MLRLHCRHSASEARAIPRKVPMNTLVFVYGSLKRGYWNNVLLEQSEFLGNAHTVSKFRMRTVAFPLLLEARDGSDRGRVRGEVYAVDAKTLAELDILEG